MYFFEKLQSENSVIGKSSITCTTTFWESTSTGNFSKRGRYVLSIHWTERRIGVCKSTLARKF